MKGSYDPREVFDLVNNKIDETLLHHLKLLNNFRRTRRTFDMQLQFRQAEDNLLTFTLGTDILVILVNTQDEILHHRVQIKNHPFKEGDRLCNLFIDYDCVSVNPITKTIVVTMISGYPKVYTLIKPATVREQLQRISPRLIMTLLVALLTWLYYSRHQN
jgi:hypothetical protein